MKLVRTDQGYLLPVPQDVVDALDLHEGDEVDLKRMPVSDDRAAAQDASVEIGLQIIRRFRGSIPADFRFDRDENDAR